MRIAFGTDHGGFSLRNVVITTVQQLGHEVVDMGAAEYLSTDDYPDYAIAVGRAVQSGEAERGILVCGSGVGVVIAANKISGVRACLCHDTYSAAQGVEHDSMNVLCLGGRIIGTALAQALVRAFLTADFNTDPRFARRLEKVQSLEK